MKHKITIKNIIVLILLLLLNLRVNAQVVNNTDKTVHDVEVISLIYIPDTNNDGFVDEDKTGIVKATNKQIKDKVLDQLYNAINTYSQTTAYHGYKDTSARPSIRYHVDPANIKFFNKLPVASTTYKDTANIPFPDYKKLLSNNTDGVDLCSMLASINKPVEIWMWSPHYGNLSITEYKVWGNNIKWEFGSGPMPDCGEPYILYNFSYLVSSAQVLHNRGHLIESFLQHFDQNFKDLFLGVTRTDLGNGSYNFTVNPTACGDIHVPPYANNTTYGGYWYYGYENQNSFNTSCENWLPGQTGTQKGINREIIKGYYENDPNIKMSKTEYKYADQYLYELPYIAWWMQNFPGYNNNLVHNSKPLRNFWDVMVYYDQMAANGWNFYLASDTATGQSTQIWQTVENPNDTYVLSKMYSNGIYSKASPSWSAANKNLYYKETTLSILCFSDDKYWVKIGDNEYMYKTYLYYFNEDQVPLCSQLNPTGTYTNKSTTVYSEPNTSSTALTSYPKLTVINPLCKVTGTPTWIKENSSENRYIVSTDLNNVPTLNECPTPGQETVYTGTARTWYNVRTGPATTFPKVYVTVPGRVYSFTCQVTNQGIVWSKFTDGNYSVKANIIGLPDTLPTCGQAQPPEPDGTYTNKSTSVRSGPGTTYSIVATYAQNTIIVPTCKVTNTSGTWIKETSTTEKYINSTDLNKIPTNLNDCPIVNPNPTTYKGIAQRSYNVRSGPSTAYPVQYATVIGREYEATCHITTAGYTWAKFIDGNYSVKSNILGLPTSMPICN